MSQNNKNLRKKNIVLAVNILMVVAGMVMMCYAMVPLYRLICQKTGFDGTPKIAKAFPNQIINRTVRIKFDTNMDVNLGWEFKPEQNHVDVKIGQNGLAFFHATNPGTEANVGMAVYGVTPEKAAQYFNKVQCFCFNKQIIKPGQTVQFPVSFFIDPEFVKDKFMNDVDTITLSYTFYKYTGKK